ncbi:MAG TPA: DUF2142 domain-containing protein [Desulfomonilaceae bacterium]|nr:DUF2142 domain-containing protein [Desulfomonilaceae bacterium]
MDRLGVLSILTLFFIFAILMAFMIPPGEAPDEPAHVNYVNFVAENLDLPNQYHHDKRILEGHQPPLYYLIGSVLNLLLNSDRVIHMNLALNPRQRYEKGKFQENVPVYLHLVEPLYPGVVPLLNRRDDRFNFYVLRMLAVLFGAANILFVLKTAQLLVKDQTWSLVPAFLVATLPTFIFMSAVVNNDCMANTLSTITIYYSFRTWLVPEKKSNFVLLGLALGLALLAKKTTLVLVPPVAIILAAGVFAHRSTTGIKTLRGIISDRSQPKARNGQGSESEIEAGPVSNPVLMSLISFIVAGAISGWWFLRNEFLYGDPLGTQMEMATIMLRETSILSRDTLGAFLAQTYISFTGLFGWGNIKLPHLIYLIHFTIFGICGIGFLLRLWRDRLRDMSLMFLLLYVMVAVAAFLYANNRFPHDHGRLLFPVLSVIAIQVALGAEYLLAFLRNDFLKRSLTQVVIVGLVLVDILSVIIIHQFYYHVQQYLK